MLTSSKHLSHVQQKTFVVHYKSIVLYLFMFVVGSDGATDVWEIEDLMSTLVYIS